MASARMPSMLSTTFQVRPYRRFPVQCLVYFSTGTVTGTGTIWNLSLGGSWMDSDICLACGMVLKLFVMLPELQHGIVVDRATVCWCRGHEVQEAARLQNFITACV